MSARTRVQSSSPDIGTAAHVAALDGRVRALLGAQPTADGAPDLALAVAREQLEDRLSRDAATWSRDTVVEACDLLRSVDEVQRIREERAVRERLTELARIQRAVDALSGLSTDEAVRRAPIVLCESCDVGRGMISAVVGSIWVPRHLHITPGHEEHADSFQEYISSARIPLAHTLLEAELVRRRVAGIVDDTAGDERTFKPIVEAGQSAAYVVAPIMSRGRAIGFVHADRHDGDTRVTDHDRDRLAAFASCFGLLHEQTLLRDRLAAQRLRSRAAFADAESSLIRLQEDAVRLDDALRSAAEVADGPTRQDAGGPTAQRVQDLLTSREREVLGLMTEGATNTRIAEQLVIAEGTVKSHVKNILRKLRAPTRSAAVARYAHLTRRSNQVA
ncbi:helix-turn-helix transcriptional regulator [Patulibacter minatonensis]|uniref:helix-turn-helix transcriptional regulator n=1 Tax=Patulibacter minatonensis TaxID=298163 RepID=UPI0006867F3A|nr:LuxR C-terminal-related transcriptional regulator [Patulibacter minatonensis]